MTDYEIDIRSIEPEYNHTLAKQAGREVDDGFEVHLARFHVELTLASGTGNDYDVDAFAVRFDVDHEAETVRPRLVGDAHNDRQNFGVEKLLTALEYADRAAIAYLEDVGPDYKLQSSEMMAEAVGQHGDDVVVHPDLEVTDA